MNCSYDTKTLNRFWSKVKKSTDDKCWLWAGCTMLPPSYPYGRFSYPAVNHIYAHRFSWQVHNGVIPDGMMVLHKCDVPGCVNPKHLFLGTAQDNMTDKVNKGRLVSSPGEKNGQCKLTDIQVKEIRERYAKGGIYLRELGAEYGVSKQQISRICRHERR